MGNLDERLGGIYKYDGQLGLSKVKTLLDLLGSRLGGGKGHVQVTMIWDIWNPTHLLRALQGHGLHPGIPGRLEALKKNR